MNLGRVVRGIAFGASLLALPACPPQGAEVPKPAEASFHLQPLTDLIASPGLDWLVHVHLRELYEDSRLATELEVLVDSAQMQRFAEAHGGLDPRALHELLYARYQPAKGKSAPGVLWAGRGFVPAGAVEKAELQAIPYVRQHLRDPSGLIRIEGREGGEPVEVLLFGHQGALRASAAPTLAKAARAFAEGKLKRAKPALSSPALAAIQETLHEAKVRIYAPRPDRTFAGDGLFERFEALGIGLSPAPGGESLQLEVTVCAVGSFSEHEDAVEALLRARLDRLEQSRTGRLLGFGPQPGAAAPGWQLQVDARRAIAKRRVDARAALRGLHRATSASTEELFSEP